jgi:uncharacterized protein YggE
MSTRTTLALVLSCGLAAAIVVPSAPAAAPSAAPSLQQASSRTGGITVTGRGEVRVLPDEVLVALRIRSRETSPMDSHSKFKERRALFDKAMAAFDDVPLRLESQGVRIGVRVDRNQVFINGQPQASAPFETQETVHAFVELGEDDAANVDLVSEIVQAAVDVDCGLDANDSDPFVYNPRDQQKSAVQYRLSREALVAARNEAMRKAMDDARQQAATLAVLAGRPLGQIENVTITEAFPEATEASGQALRAVKLSVRFSLAE